MAKKILVAEDERPMTNAMKLKLEKEGFEVTVAYNGEEALTALKKEKFDLALLDLIMPKLTGFQVLEALKKEGIAVKVIVTTNLSQAEDKKRAMALGASDFIVKAETPISKIVELVKTNT